MRSDATPAQAARRSTALWPVVALLALGFAGPAVAEGPELAEPPPLVVEIVVARAAPDLQTISLTGVIAARRTLNAAFSNAGRLAEVFVREGDRVAAGDRLARIESVTQEQALRSREAALAAAEAALRQARSEFERYDALLARGAVTRTARDQTEDAVVGAEASVAEALAERDLARKDLEDTVLRAPADAVVTARDAEVGQVVSAAETVISLALGADFDAVFDVPEVLLTVPREAQGVSLHLVDAPAAAFGGEVREVSPVVDAAKGTVQVKVGVADPPAGIAIGAAVLGTVTFEEAAVVTLPHTALTATAAGPAVWVVEPGDRTVRLRQVRVVRHETGRVVIGEGLRDGEAVVAAGSQLLYRGRPVRGIDAAASQ